MLPASQDGSFFSKAIEEESGFLGMEIFAGTYMRLRLSTYQFFLREKNYGQKSPFVERGLFLGSLIWVMVKKS